MSYKGDRNLDANDGISRSYIGKFGDTVLLPSRDWILKMWKPKKNLVDRYVPLRPLSELEEESARTGIPIEVLMARSVARSRESIKRRSKPND